MSLMSAGFSEMAFRPTQGCQWIAGIRMPETTRLYTFLSLDAGSACRYDG